MNYCKWCNGEIWGYEQSCPHCKRNLVTGMIDSANAGFSSSNFFNSMGQDTGSSIQRPESNRQTYPPNGGIPNQQMVYPPNSGMPNQQMGYSFNRQQYEPSRRKKKNWIPILILVILLLGVGTVGILGYTGIIPIPFFSKTDGTVDDGQGLQIDIDQDNDLPQVEQAQEPDPQMQESQPQVADAVMKSYEELYFYYSTLSPDEKIVYEDAVREIESGNMSIKINVPIAEDEVEHIFDAIYYDRSELFWLSGEWTYHTQTSGNETIVVQMDFKGNGLEQDLQNNRERFDAAVNILLEGLEGRSVLEQEREIHDRVVKSVEYVTDSEYNQSVYSAIVNKQTVCAGYARAMQYLLTRLGIPCYYCCGDACGEDSWESHGWNILKLGDQYYNLDSCWDDPIKGTYSAYYTYYNITDDQIFENHRRAPEAEVLPHCNSTEYSFEAIYGIPRQLGVLEEAGAADAPIYQSVQEFKDGLYQFVVAHGYGTNDFIYVLYGEDLYNMVCVMEQERWDVISQAMQDCGMSCSSERYSFVSQNLEGGYYLMTETITIDP